ncbi:hypothetical protein J6590_078724 [Homalodisca vitripennis]|nr:hypothetical protein J6590_078724 [Homalodisca vitripennis]
MIEWRRSIVIVIVLTSMSWRRKCALNHENTFRVFIRFNSGTNIVASIPEIIFLSAASRGVVLQLRNFVVSPCNLHYSLFFTASKPTREPYYKQLAND